MPSPPAMDTVTDTCPALHQNGSAHRESPEARASAAVLRIHFYHSAQGAADCSFLSYPPGNYVAEELCIDGAKACSEYLGCASPHNEPSFMCVLLGIGPQMRLSRGHSEIYQHKKMCLLVQSSQSLFPSHTFFFFFHNVDQQKYVGLGRWGLNWPAICWDRMSCV